MLTKERLKEIREEFVLLRDHPQIDEWDNIFELRRVYARTVGELLSELDRVTRWRDIIKEEPENGQMIVAFGADGTYILRQYNGDMGIWEGGVQCYSYWLPLPQLPSKEERI